MTLPVPPHQTPRPWQIKAIGAIGPMFRQHQSLICASATGTGKGTLIAGLACMSARKGNRVLVLAERNNLVHEIPHRIKQIVGAPNCGIIRGARNEWLNPIVSASVQTLASPSRLAALDRYKPKLVITDECFPGGTMISMADGTTKPIEQVVVGDVVLAFDEASKQMVPRPVVRLFHSKTRELVHVRAKGRSVRATPGHPFYTERGWVQAASIACQRSSTRGGRPMPVYNLEVEDVHTYVANGFVVHNCHHSVAPSYRAIYDHLDNVSPGWKHLGMTATPFRTGPDGSTLGLGAVFEAVAFEYTIEDAIAAGDLVPIRSYQVDSTLSLDSVRTGADGDYDEADLAKAVDCDSRNDLVVDEYERLLTGQPAAVFCVNILHAENMAARFQARGINAIAVSGQTKNANRILADFKHGKFPVICSCDLIREGWDAPNVVGILKARPTKSLLVFTQMIGRGTRTSPSTGKTECIFVDFVDNGCTFTLETIANLSADEADAQSRPIMVGDDVQRRHYDAWGTGTVLDMREVGPVTEYQVGWPMTEENPKGRIAWHPRKELRKARQIGEVEDKPEPLQPKIISSHRYEIQLFGRIGKGAPPAVGWYEYDGALIAGGTLGEPIRRFNNGRWVTSSTEVKLYLHHKPTGWEVWSLRRDPAIMEDNSVFYTEKVTSERRDLFDRGTAVLWAQEHLRALGVRIIDHTAQWRGENATERQRAALRSWGIKRDTSTMSRGEASVLLDAVVARRKVSEASGGGKRRRGAR